MTEPRHGAGEHGEHQGIEAVGHHQQHVPRILDEVVGGQRQLLLAHPGQRLVNVPVEALDLLRAKQGLAPAEREN